MNKYTVLKKSKRSNLFKYIFYLLIILIIIVLFWTDKMGDKQDEEFLDDYTLLQTLINQTSNQAPNTIEQLSALQQKYSNEYLIAYHLGIAYLNEGNIQQALIMYKRTLDLNPFVVENKEFMYQYALILGNNEQIDNAMRVVERAKQLSPNEEYQSKLNSLVESIEKN
ncbi:tetratricopeptide repeat protein [Psychrobacillus psychrodurans]|uniref:tetratricopeptide repeat protein n=1 Tax=Psychrobacillus psychrodurans TaxID=126157 RepID=UPI001F4E58CD|nr:tetratricopeptide repeat protein [Psychrobacillus psychrodurans]MCK1995781.1 tetratricopeptide repeat protein [Psychrobacillus psychrodurans]